MESSIYILQRRSVFLLSMCHIYVSVIYIPIPAAVSADSSLWASISWFQRGWCLLAGLNLQDISLLWTNKAAFARYIKQHFWKPFKIWDSSDSLTSIFMFLLCSEYFGPILVPPEMQIQCWSGQTPHSINWVASQRLRLQPCVHCVCTLYNNKMCTIPWTWSQIAAIHLFVLANLILGSQFPPLCLLCSYLIFVNSWILPHLLYLQKYTMLKFATK